MYLITTMEINILLEVLNPSNHARLPDTLPGYQTHPAQLPDAPMYKLNGFQCQQKLHNRVKALKYYNYIH